jgi:CubicO group peptidase (beta-lactamase class C family)
MLATTDGYADFLRMLLSRGELNGHRFLEESTIEEITSPHTQLDNDYGYNGYNLWVNNGKLADGSQGVGGLWIGGGYEGTYFWIDPEREFVGLIMSQIFWVPESGRGSNEVIREAIYAQLSGY